MPIFETFYCPKKKEHIVRCIEKIVFNKKEGRIDEITCKHWKKKIGCTFNPTNKNKGSD